jgi:hypothetical protein
VAVTVGAEALVKIGTGQGNTHRCELQDVLGRELGALMGSGCKRKEELIVAASTATARHGAAALPRARNEWRQRFIGGASWRGGACTSRISRTAVWAPDGGDVRPVRRRRHWAAGTAT